MSEMVSRFEDMSPRGRLAMMIQEDGDIIVLFFLDENVRPSMMPSVEFCSIGAGGGKSPHTRKALRDLYDAIKKDNEENPQSRG